jgi:hypothetical protein
MAFGLHPGKGPRQALVAIRYSHARNVDRPSKVSR